ncbi:ISH10-type transposase ISHwa10, partial [Halococcus thailandensis JCM 13552]
EGEPIYRALKQLYVALQTRLESDLTVRERGELQRVARRELELLIERSVPDGPVATLLGKIEGGLDHWLTFIGEPAV